MSQQSNLQFEHLPPLSHDRAFGAMTATQFLGAFNDNLFKQLVLLICLDYAKAGGNDYQSIALALFAIPFVLFSGFGGYLSDRNSKRLIVVLCKVTEIAVMAAGWMALWKGELWALFVVLFLMSTQSAFFGPAKYGILPEMFRESDLPQVNGVIQMTTFLAIIFGCALAGYSKERFEARLWVVSGLCIGIAAVGTLTSLLVRKTRVAHPGLPFQPSSLAISRETRAMLRDDRPLLGVLLMSSLFWFVAGVVQPAVNAFGKLEMQLGDGRTSVLGACIAIGIAAGCLLAGKASHKTVNFRLVTVGATGIVGSLAVMAWLGISQDASAALADTSIVVAKGIAKTPESLWELCFTRSNDEFYARLVLTGLGLSAGLFVVPLQVYMQARPPDDQKGRMIGAMNLINWIGIVFSAIFYGICERVFSQQMLDVSISWIFAALAVLMLPAALLYRPKRAELARLK